MAEFTSKYDVEKTMYEKFADSVAARGDKPCFYYYNNTVSFNEADEMVNLCAAALKANGVQKGDRVIVCAPNMPQCITAIYAINKIGAIASMLHPLSVASEAQYAVNLVGAKFAFCFDVSEKAFTEMKDLTLVKCRTAQYFPKTPYGFIANMLYKKKIKGKTAPAKGVKKLIDWKDFLNEGKEYLKNNQVKIETDPYATAVTMMTGGTTGNPKAVMLSNYNINNLSYEVWDVVDTVIQKKIDPDNDAMLTALPVFHGFGFGMCMHYSIIVGQPQVLFPQFDAKMCSDAIKKYHVNYVFGVPDFFEKVYKAGYLKGVDMSTMKLIGSGGDVVPYSLTEKMDRMLKENGSKFHFATGYGLTECVTVCSFTDMRREAPQGCIGLPTYNIEVSRVLPRRLSARTASFAFTALLLCRVTGTTRRKPQKCLLSTRMAEYGSTQAICAISLPKQAIFTTVRDSREFTKSAVILFTPRLLRNPTVQWQRFMTAVQSVQVTRAKPSLSFML